MSKPVPEGWHNDDDELGPSACSSVRERYGDSWLGVAPPGSKCPGPRRCQRELAGQGATKSKLR